MDPEDSREGLIGQAAWQPDGTSEIGTGKGSLHCSSFGSFSFLQFSLHPLHMFGNIVPNPQLQPGQRKNRVRKT